MTIGYDPEVVRSGLVSRVILIDRLMDEAVALAGEMAQTPLKPSRPPNA